MSTSTSTLALRGLLRSVPGLFGWVTFAAAIAVLVGWSFDSDTLRSVGSGLETMKPITAVALAALGASVALGRRVDRPPPGIAVALAALAGLIGLVTLGEYVLSTPSGFDTVLFTRAVRAEPIAHPGRMAPLTAVCLLAAAGAVLLRWRGRRRQSHLFAAIVTLLSGVAIAGYLYGVRSMHGAGPYTTMALNTAVGLNLLGIGLLWSTPDRGLLGLARQRGTTAALLVHYVVPAVVVLPLLFGWLDLRWMRAGSYSAEFALAIMATAAGAIGGLVLWWAVRSVAEIEAARSDAMAALASTNQRLEEQVRERTASFERQAAIGQACLEALEQGVVLSSLDAEVLFVNRAGRDLLGFEPEELSRMYRSGEWVSYRESGEVLPVSERPIRTTMDTGQPVVGKILVWRVKGGRAVTMRVTTQPVFDAAGELTGVVTAVADVSAERAAQRAAADHLTEVTELNRQLEQAVLMKDRFLSTATHDMRSPITTIIGFADLLTLEGVAVPPHKRDEYLVAIKRQGQRLEALVQDLLSIAVLDGGSVSFDPRVIDLGAAVRQSATDAGAGESIQIRVTGSAVAFADPVRLAQMLTNLFQNAIRYGRPPVVASVAGDATWATIRVCDQGDGVDPVFVPRLFDRFTTDRRRADPETIGTGLGLAIVRGLAQMHGGDAWYEPNEPKGACFVLRLPTNEPELVRVARGPRAALSERR
ncbi:MAG: ATP-binding protein [Microthrixaceae bacterium]